MLACRKRKLSLVSPSRMYFNVRAILIMASTLKQLLVPKGKHPSAGQGTSQPELDSDSDPNLKREVESDRESVDTLAAQPQSPSPEAEYDKLLVSRKIHYIITWEALVLDCFLCKCKCNWSEQQLTSVSYEYGMNFLCMLLYTSTQWLFRKKYCTCTPLPLFDSCSYKLLLAFRFYNEDFGRFYIQDDTLLGYSTPAVIMSLVFTTFTCDVITESFFCSPLHFSNVFIEVTI